MMEGFGMLISAGGSLALSLIRRRQDKRRARRAAHLIGGEEKVASSRARADGATRRKRQSFNDQRAIHPSAIGW
jgi:hypothetical protein